MNPEIFFNQKKKFFFKDRDLTADYVKENCKEELSRVIKIADDVVSQKFVFNLRWDMERTYEPVVFEKEIDWLYQPADDPEWSFAFNRMRFWICLGQAYAVTKNEIYAETFVKQLLSWIRKVKRENPECKNAWRTIEAGLRLEYWLKAIWYFKDSPSINSEVMDEFILSVVEHADFLSGIFNSYNLMSNWGVLANHGLFIAGVMLPDVDERISEKNKYYREKALSRLEQEIKIQVYEDGVHWEQSPMYHNEITHDFLDVVILAHRNNIPLPKVLEEATYKLCYADVIAQKPDGNELSMGDSDEIDLRDIVTKGAFVFNDSILKSGAYTHLDFDSVWDLGAECCKEYDSLPVETPNSLANSFLESGNFFVRSSWNKDSSFLHFHAGTLGAGHGHADQLHIDLFNNGEDILIDSGRYSYVAGPKRYGFKDSNAHNTCTVDRKNFYNDVDSWSCSKLDRAINKTSKETRDFTYFEAGHLYYLYLKNGGVYINRKIIYIKPDIFILCDEFYSSKKHYYQQYFHFNNSGKIKMDKEKNIVKVEYKSDLNNVEFTLLGKDISSRMTEGKISRHYNQAKKSPVLMTEWKAKSFSSLFTVISLNGSCLVKKVPVLSNFKNALFPNNMIESLEIEKDNRKWTVVIAHQEYASPTDTYCAGGISFEKLKELGIESYQPGNNGKSGNEWGAVNSKEGCTGFGQVTVFNTAVGENKIGTTLLV